MEIEEILLLISDFIITVFCYLVLPATLKFILYKNYSNKKALTISILNSIMIYLLLSIIHLYFIDSQSILNTKPMFFYTFISYCILQKNIKVDNKEKHTNHLHKKESILSKYYKFIIFILIIIILFLINTFIYTIGQCYSEIETYEKEINSLNSKINTLTIINKSLNNSNSSIADSIINGTYTPKY